MSAAAGAGPEVALVVGERQWAREAQHLRRRAVALIGEGCGPTIVAPIASDDAEYGGGAAERPQRRLELPRIVEYRARVPFWLRGDRLSRVAQRFERRVPDLVWACGSDAWAFALALADRLDRPAVLECRCVRELVRVARSLRHESVVGLAVPCEALARAARGRFGEAMVRLVPLGVPVAEKPREDAQEGDRPRYAAILAGDAEPAEFEAALRAFAQLSVERPGGLLAGIELPARRASAAWRLVRELGMLGTVTTLERSALTLRAVEAADFLVIPERCGGPRVETLIGLGLGLPVVAAADPNADALIDGETAHLIERGSGPTAWGEAMRRVLTQPAEANAMGERARQLVAARHRTPVWSGTFASVAGELARGPTLRYSPHQV
jgi:glycosyltransferase involved in cell wall biosynthesis